MSKRTRKTPCDEVEAASTTLSAMTNKVLQWSEERTAAFVKTHKTEHVAALDLTRLPDKKQAWPFVRLERLLKLEPHVDEKWTVFKTEASLVELRVVCDNPYYAMFAFSIPFANCVAVAKSLGVTLNAPVFTYMVLGSMLREAESVDREELRAKLLELGLSPCSQNMCTVHPFDRRLLLANPLFACDLNAVPPAQLKLLVPPGTYISAERERRCLANQVALVNDRYVMRTPLTEFIIALRGQNGTVVYHSAS